MNPSLVYSCIQDWQLSSNHEDWDQQSVFAYKQKPWILISLFKLYKAGLKALPELKKQIPSDIYCLSTFWLQMWVGFKTISFRCTCQVLLVYLLPLLGQIQDKGYFWIFPILWRHQSPTGGDIPEFHLLRREGLPTHQAVVSQNQWLLSGKSQP
jgi:hypothetical protein